MVHFLLPCLIFSARERKLLLPNNDGANSKQMLSRQSQPWRLRADDEYAGFLNWKNNKQYVHTAHTYINLHISYIIFGNIPIMNIWQTINSKASESNLFNHLASFQKKTRQTRQTSAPIWAVAHFTTYAVQHAIGTSDDVIIVILRQCGGQSTMICP